MFLLVYLITYFTNQPIQLFTKKNRNYYKSTSINILTPKLVMHPTKKSAETLQKTELTIKDHQIDPETHHALEC